MNHQTNSPETLANDSLINNRYRIIKPLRTLDPRSSTGLFEIEDNGTRKTLKILRTNQAKALELFEREALTLQWLNHPGIPHADIDGYFSFTPANSSQKWHCLVMDFIEGENLENWVTENGPISQETALNWLKQLVEILKILHDNRFFHRDIKPSNIIVKSNSTDNQLVLIDFGSVREITDTYLAKISGGEGITSIISAGYTPLEQVNGKAVPQSDFYALGRTFVHLITGKHPVTFADDPQNGQLLWRESATDICKPLADLIDDLIAPFPGQRPQTTEIILHRLEEIKQGLNRPVMASWQRFNLKLAGLLLLGGIGLGIGLPQMAVYLQTDSSSNLPDISQKSTQPQFFRLDRFFNELGYKNRKINQFMTAEFYFNLAVRLNSNNGSAHYNLGLMCEDRRDFKCASKHYQIAAENDNNYVAAAGINNLSRLQIWLEGDNDSAVNLIRQGLQRAESDAAVPKAVKSSLEKNLGWALLNQASNQQGEENAMLTEAQFHLQQAIDLNHKNAAAQCLLAQALEAKKDRANSLIAWQRCLDIPSPYNPEAITWKSTARQRLNAVQKEAINYENRSKSLKKES